MRSLIIIIKKVIKTIVKKDVLIQFARTGKNVNIPSDVIVSGGANITIYDNVSCGPGLVLFATNAKIVIKSNFIASHNLKIITGDHERRIGRFCASITEAEKNHNIALDKDVVINEDVWCGINVTILKGVTIGRGCTICAGAVVAKSTPPYAIIGGTPARFIKFYWAIDDILKHEASLYPQEERFSREELEFFFMTYK
jgi:acetyltransferase-like isoleucine patch superfamily enzyme